MFKSLEDLENLPQEYIRDAVGKAVLDLGKERKEVVVITTDVGGSTRAIYFAKEFPQRFIQLGVAEQNAIGVSAGLALQGFIPFYFGYSVFNSGRTWEQIRTLLCYQNLKVRIVATHAGIATGPDGATHQMTEDIAIMRVLPHIKVFSPADAIEAERIVKEVVDLEGPVYIRVPRAKFPVFTKDLEFKLGKVSVLKEGKDLTLLATGPVVLEALKASLELEREGISSAVLNCHSIKPLDLETILDFGKRTQRLVTVEDHQIAGGLGSAVAEALSEVYPIKILRIGLRDTFGESGNPQELYSKYGLDFKGIYQKIKSWLKDEG